MDILRFLSVLEADLYVDFTNYSSNANLSSTSWFIIIEKSYSESY